MAQMAQLGIAGHAQPCQAMPKPWATILSHFELFWAILSPLRPCPSIPNQTKPYKNMPNYMPNHAQAMGNNFEPFWAILSHTQPYHTKPNQTMPNHMPIHAQVMGNNFEQFWAIYSRFRPCWPNQTKPNHAQSHAHPCPTHGQSYATWFTLKKWKKLTYRPPAAM